MKTQRGQSAFPTAFLTFSLLLLVLAAGFAVGRLIVGRAYLQTAGRLQKLPVGAPEPAPQTVPEVRVPRRDVHVPRPAPREEPEEAEQEPGAAESLPGAVEDEPDAPSSPPPLEEPEQVAEPPQIPRPAVPEETRYSIQVGLFESQQGARRLADELMEVGYPARIEVVQAEAGPGYRVLTGRYRTEYAARKAADQLRQEGFPGFLVKR